MQKNIELTIGDTDFKFTVTTDDYNQFVNDTLPHDKIGPANNLCVRTINEEQRKDLVKLLEQPGLAIEIVSTLMQDFMTDIKVSVKKSKPSTSK